MTALSDDEVLRGLLLDAVYTCCVCSKVGKVRWYQLEKAEPFRVHAPVCECCFDADTACPNNREALKEVVSAELVVKLHIDD